MKDEISKFYKDIEKHFDNQIENIDRCYLQEYQALKDKLELLKINYQAMAEANQTLKLILYERIDDTFWMVKKISET